MADYSSSETRAKSSIPVPEVHSYDVHSSNDVGAPYILMDYIDGMVASEMREAKNSKIGLFGNCDQDEKFRRQMASIQVELSSFRFDHIGSLYQDERTSDFFIGPELETGKGLWTSPIEFYHDLANHVIQVCAREATSEIHNSSSFAVPVLFKELISYVYRARADNDQATCLTNRDFGAHNLLVNDDFDIIGVIDFDGVIAAPIELVAQYPQLTGLDPEPPGHIETRPAAVERIKQMQPKLNAYREMIAQTEADMFGDREEIKIARHMLSNAASMVQGLRQFASHQKSVNDKWMTAFVKLLRDYANLVEL